MGKEETYKEQLRKQQGREDIFTPKKEEPEIPRARNEAPEGEKELQPGEGPQGREKDEKDSRAA